MRPGVQYAAALRGRRGLGLIEAPQLETPDTGLGPTGTTIVASGPGAPAPAPTPAAVPLPSLSSMTPAQLTAGVPAVVTFNGANFLSGDTVHSAGFSVQSVSVVSSSRIVATVLPTSAVGLRGSFLAAVLTPQNQESNAVQFAIVPAASVSPTQPAPPTQPTSTGLPALPPVVGSPIVVSLPPTLAPPSSGAAPAGSSSAEQPGVSFVAPSFEGQLAPPIQGSGDQVPASSASSGIWAQLSAVPWWAWAAAAVGVGYVATRPRRRRR